ncbi:hypothetical protein G9464_19115 [Halostella sp. JP-L12]|uniref:hypothetical protein n=1 Tax=Halostella TaxID=1843185 RepID=UPI000EF80A39|nr:MULTISPECIES: hypothetical protein [Halostella]NHN49683.1 hypothetical protein [Halostella sp. JP-L12]
MEWRCEWCGKPHEENDPPCDNCGHGKFEEAVVRQSTGTVDTGTTYVWDCEECGRSHPKNSPPCSRCGHMHLEKREQRFDETELETGSYFDLGKEYIAASVALVTVVALVAAGVIPVPGLGGDDLGDVPGEAESADGRNLSAVERGIVEGVNERRADAGVADLRTDEELDAVAERYNQIRVKRQYGEDAPDEDLRDSFESVGYSCSRTPAGAPYVVQTDGDERAIRTYDENELSAAVVRAYVGDPSFGSRLLSDGHREIGTDVHVAPDGDVFVMVTVC